MEIVTWAVLLAVGAWSLYCAYRLAEWYWRGRPYSWDRKDDEEAGDDH